MQSTGLRIVKPLSIAEASIHAVRCDRQKNRSRRLYQQAPSITCLPPFGQVPLPFDSALQFKQSLLTTAATDLMQCIVDERPSCTDSGEFLTFVDQIVVNYHVCPSHMVTPNYIYARYDCSYCVLQGIIYQLCINWGLIKSIP